MRVEERGVNEYFLCVIYMGSNSEIKEIHSRTVVNGVVTEDIHLISQKDDNKLELKGSINGKPVNMLRTQSPRPALATKKVRFANDAVSVSNGLDRMATPFAPMIVYETRRPRRGRKSRRSNRRKKTQRKRGSRRQKR